MFAARTHAHLLFALSGLLCAVESAAQALPDSAPEFRRQQEQVDILRERNAPANTLAPKVITATEDGRLPEEVPCRVVQTVQLHGDISDSLRAQLQEALSGGVLNDAPQGRCLGGRGIQTLLDRLRNRLVEQGYITSQVTAPAQDLSAGTLRLDVSMATIDQTKTGDSPLSSVGLPFAHVSGDLLNLRDLEQTLENLRRVPQAKVNLDIKPGTVDGTSDIDIQFQPSQPVRLNLSLDDGGGRSTGQWQGSATVHWDNPSGNADLFYVSLSPTVAGKEAGPRGSRSQVVHYSLPIGYWSVGLTATRSAYHQTIAGAFQSYVYSGRSDQTDIQVGRVLRRDGLSKTQASLKAFSRGSSNFIDDTEVEVQRRRTAGWELNLSHLHYIGAGVLDLQWLYRRGTGAFGAMPAPEELFDEGTSRMKLMQLSANWQQPFSVAERTWRYVGHWRLQHNQTPLTPQDKFCAGGRHTVRGFDGKQSACADRGLLWRNEFSTSLGDGKPQLYLALDHARLHRSQEQEPQTLTGAAIGLRQGWALLGGQASVDAFVAQPVRKPEHIRTAKTTTGIQFHWAF